MKVMFIEIFNNTIIFSKNTAFMLLKYKKISICSYIQIINNFISGKLWDKSNE